MSVGKNDFYQPTGENGVFPEFGDENLPPYQYEEVKENDFISPSANPDSTFSLDRNTASYTYARRILNNGSPVPESSVRIEELVNYFSYDYPLPQNGEALNVIGTLSTCPWNEDHKLFKIGIKAEDIDFSQKKRNNLVFLIDTSGSMYGPDRLPLVQQAFNMLVENLDDNDIISVVTYASGTRVVAEGMPGKDKLNITNVISDLQAGGSTAGASGINLAYNVAEKYFIEDGNNRIILATDGDFNVGVSSKLGLKNLVSRHRDRGIYLSVMGVGFYNTNDTTMKTLAENGNGNYGYLDSVQEAKKMLVTEMGGTLVTVAKDAKIKVSFNSEVVKQYRLIGYETKMMTNEEFEDENKDAGEIGAGHTVTAIYELSLNEGKEGSFANCEIRYKDPATNEQKSIKRDFSTVLLNEEVDEETIFASCVTEFGLILRNSKYKNNASLISVEQRLNSLSCINSADCDELRYDFFNLVKEAQGIYSRY